MKKYDSIFLQMRSECRLYKIVILISMDFTKVSSSMALWHRAEHCSRVMIYLHSASNKTFPTLGCSKSVFKHDQRV